MVDVIDVTEVADVIALLLAHKVFNVLWSPLLPDVLLSGSDDCSVRVWDTRSLTSRVICGHTHNVRALAWSHEIPWLAMSGSWDGTLRLWDTRSCTSIGVLRDHHADIYAITSHPMRPSVFVSTSRDTTMRTWCLDELATPVLLPLVLGEPLAPLRAAASTAMHPTDPSSPFVACCGAGSATLEQRIAGAPSSAARCAAIFDFFRPARGMSNLWDMLIDMLDPQAQAARAAPGARGKDADEVVHGAHLIESKRDLLRQLMADVDVPSSRMVLGRRVKQEERLRMAATLSLQLGEMQQHCEVPRDGTCARRA